MYLVQRKVTITTMSEINVLFFDNTTASHCWRIDGPAKHINTKTEHGVFVTPYNTWNENIVDANIVVMEMLSSPGMVDKCHELGAKVIFEADDAFIDSYGKERKNLMHLEGKSKEMTLETLKRVDALTVTNEVLRDNYARFTDAPIYVLPNYIDLDWYGKELINIERNSDEVRIGWFGSQGHLEDLQMVIPAMREVLAKYPQAKFIYCGFGGMSSDRKVTEIGWGEDVFKELPRTRREFYVGVAEQYWPMKHRMLDLDIGIAPLIDDYFNTCKTPIKWMEYSLLSTPSVCSPTLYAGCVDNEKTGYIAKTTDEWINALSLLVEDKAKRESVGKLAREKVLEDYNIEDYWERWVDVYRDVLG